MSARTAPVKHEMSAWMRGTVGRRCRQIADRVPPGELRPDDLIVTMLGDAVAVEDETTCDRCRRYCPNGEHFAAVAMRVAPQVILVAGLCDVCYDREFQA